MKKYIYLLIVVIIISGCYFKKDIDVKIDDFFKKYQNLSSDVLDDLEFNSEKGILSTNEEKQMYIEAMKMQYSSIKYEIINENIKDNTADISIKIIVFDFYKAQKEANDYIAKNPETFISSNGNLDEEKIMLFRLRNMLETYERIEHVITLHLDKKDDEWTIKPLDKTTLEKIHGTYNYEL